MATAQQASQPISANPSPIHPTQIQRSNSGDDGDISPSPPSHSSSEGEYMPKASRLQRPKLPTRKSSGTLIIARDNPTVELTDEEYGPEDARTMSPRRTSEEVDALGEKARDALLEQAKELQESLLQIVERVESVKSEHEKLEGGNRFLQSYIGELMQTSKLTSSYAGKSKGKGKSSK